jgi:hypothetical protein
MLGRALKIEKEKLVENAKKELEQKLYNEKLI